MGVDSPDPGVLTLAELPQEYPNRRNWRLVTEFADAHPGRWVRVGVMHQSVRSHIKGGRYPSVNPLVYDAVTRMEDGVDYLPGHATLYLRRFA